jgi:hypothetical protein
MPSARRTPDVFISHSPRDAPLALEVANAFRTSGLVAFTEFELTAGENLSDALWEALAESRALLTIISPAGPTAWMSIETGAARAWQKPIYTVVTDPSATRPPATLGEGRLYTIGRIQDVIRDIKAQAAEFSDEDRAYLVDLYSRLNVPVDRLSVDPRRLETLVRGFQKGRGRAVTGERLLSELLRLRKRGQLHKLRPSSSSS